MHDLEPRIERMYRRDRAVAIGLVVALIATLGVIYRAIAPLTGSLAVNTVLGVAVTLVAVFNAASIRAMLRHNREEKAFIYTLDIKHLDERRLNRPTGTDAAAPHLAEGD